MRGVFINIPLPMLLREWNGFVRSGLFPEIYLTADTLDSTSPESLSDLRDAMDREGMKTTIHGPYMDLNPGAVDERIRKATYERLKQAFDLASILRPESIVFHPGYDRWRYGGHEEVWLRQSLKTWRPLVERAEEEGITIALENVFEETPETLKALVDAMGSQNFRVCFDIGHFNLFSRVSLKEWYRSLKDYIVELHLHDNRGKEDDHFAIGDGSIDFRSFFDLLKDHPVSLIYTLEPHRKEDLSRALERLKAFLP